jgi:hypothetical protein
VSQPSKIQEYPITNNDNNFSNVSSTYNNANRVGGGYNFDVQASLKREQEHKLSKQQDNKQPLTKEQASYLAKEK